MKPINEKREITIEIENEQFKIISDEENMTGFHWMIALSGLMAALSGSEAGREIIKESYEFIQKSNK